MEAKVNPDQFEKSLIDSLKGLKDPSEIKEVSKVLAHYHSLGLNVERWWKQGQPGIDVLRVAGRTPIDNFAKLSGLFKDNRVSGLRINVRGIPAVSKQFLDVQVTMRF